MDVAIVCIGTSHPGNAGALARAAANFGVTDLRFVTPRCDVVCEEALNRSVHAKQSLLDAKVVDTLEEALQGVSYSLGTTSRQTTAENRFLRKTLDIRDWVASAAQWNGKLAVVFGREDTGMTQEECDAMDALITVPTAAYSSLNLAQAVGIVCYELYLRNADSITRERALEPDTLQSMNQAWDAITDCVEPRHWRRRTAQGIWRKIVGRSMPDDHEVHNIMGILGNVLKRFDHPDFRTASSSKHLAKKGLIVARLEPDEEE